MENYISFTWFQMQTGIPLPSRFQNSCQCCQMLHNQSLRAMLCKRLENQQRPIFHTAFSFPYLLIDGPTSLRGSIIPSVLTPS